MNAEAVIAAKIKQRRAAGLSIRVTGWANYTGPDEISHRARTDDFTAHYATAEERDLMITRFRSRGLTVEQLTATAL